MHLFDLREIAERWGWAYGTTASRIYAAANTGRIRVIQRPGRQKYYLSDELEGLFGPPVNGPEPISEGLAGKGLYPALGDRRVSQAA